MSSGLGVISAMTNIQLMEKKNFLIVFFFFFFFLIRGKPYKLIWLILRHVILGIRLGVINKELHTNTAGQSKASCAEKRLWRRQTWQQVKKPTRASFLSHNLLSCFSLKQ